MRTVRRRDCKHLGTGGFERLPLSGGSGIGAEQERLAAGLRAVVLDELAVERRPEVGVDDDRDRLIFERDVVGHFSGCRSMCQLMARAGLERARTGEAGVVMKDGPNPDDNGIVQDPHACSPRVRATPLERGGQTTH